MEKQTSHNQKKKINTIKLMLINFMVFMHLKAIGVIFSIG